MNARTDRNTGRSGATSRRRFIGAGVGAGAGTAVQVMTKGEQVHVPSETLLEFSIDQPVSVPVAQGR